MATTDFVPMTKSALANPAALGGAAPSDEAATWVTWTDGFVAADGLAGILYTTIGSGLIPVPEKFKPDILAGLKGFHTALADVDKAFGDAYNDITAGKAPVVQINPLPIVDWDSMDANPKLQALQFAWETLKPALEVLLAKLAAGSQSPNMQKVVVAVNALVNSGDNIIASIKKVLAPAS